MIRPRKAVERLQKYRPPLEGRAGKLRLDFNENTVGCAPGVVRALRHALNTDWLSRYPEYEEGRAVLAEYFGVSKDEMLISNGVDDAIKLICDTFVDPGDKLVVPAPTFPIYQFFQSVAGGRTALVRYDEGLRLPVERILDAINSRTRWVALANPNNPTGTIIPKGDLRAILEAAPPISSLSAWARKLRRLPGASARRTSWCATGATIRTSRGTCGSLSAPARRRAA